MLQAERMASPIHFLHIRKTGGMAIRAALGPVAEAAGVRFHPHRIGLAQIPQAERVFFLVRDPVSRFVSGFNSRLRMGRPLFDNPWNESEARAFARFESAGALAEALAREEPDAAAAMHGIRHINQPLQSWLVSEERLRAQMPNIVWIGHTETLDADFPLLAQRLGVAGRVTLPDDAVLSHRTPGGMATALSAAGHDAVARWYGEDMRLLDVLGRMRDALA